MNILVIRKILKDDVVMWYVVQPGDSLYTIARRFGITVELLRQANRLTGDVIYIGQQLFIPYIEVIVNVDVANIRSGPGENYSIITSMVRGARLPVRGSVPGWYRVELYNGNEAWISQTVVRRYIHLGTRPVIGIAGFYTLEEGPGLPSSFSSFTSHTSLISEVLLFMFRISASNPTQIEKFGNFTDQDVRTLVAIAHRNNIKILPVVHNLLYRPGGTALARNVIKTLVSSRQNRSAFVQNLIRLIQQYNFDGVNIDIEDVFIEDRPGVSALYSEMGTALRSRGYFLSASVPARVSDQPFNPFSDPFDYSVIGRAVDQFIVMLYNEHGWPGSGPGPVVSIGWMDRVLRYAITKMPINKIVAAVSVFGFDFNLTTGRNTYVTHQAAVRLAQRYNQQIIFDQSTQTPTFSYTDEQGNRHEVWFENAASILAKIRLAWRLKISGIALWRLGMEDQGIWTAIANNVVVKKFEE